MRTARCWCEGDVIAALKARDLLGRQGETALAQFAPLKVSPSQPDQIQAERSAAALSIWKSAIPVNGTPVEGYLTSCDLTKSSPSPSFHRGLKHPSGGLWPCMVALVTRGADGSPAAIHRTFLARDGIGKAPVAPAKMMLGPCRGGAVCRGKAADVLMIGEGIEISLAAMQGAGHQVLADGDDPGEAAARDCAQRWMRKGRRVRIARPPRGMDFNDVLLGRAPGIEGDAQ